MRLVFCLLTLLTVLFTQAQTYLNLHEKTIRSELHPKHLVTKDLGGGRKCIAYQTKEQEKWWYVDDATKRCFMHVIIPKSLQLKSNYIAHFNKNYVVVSDKAWKLYHRGLVIAVALTYDPEDNVEYFAFKVIEE